jgi:hypothetical protein
MRLSGTLRSWNEGRGNNGKPQAVKVIRQAFGDTRNSKRLQPPQGSTSPRRFSTFMVLLILLSLGAYGYKHYAQKVAAYSAPESVESAPLQGKRPPEEQPAPLQQSAPDTFKCDGRTHCSQMTSCDEAKYFLKNCPGTEMDGNHDGTPCERQWCTSPFAK